MNSETWAYWTDSFSSASATNMLPTCDVTDTDRKYMKFWVCQTLFNKLQFNNGSYHTRKCREETSLIFLLFIFVLPAKEYKY